MRAHWLLRYSNLSDFIQYKKQASSTQVLMIKPFNLLKVFQVNTSNLDNPSAAAIKMIFPWTKRAKFEGQKNSDDQTSTNFNATERPVDCFEYSNKSQHPEYSKIQERPLSGFLDRTKS